MLRLRRNQKGETIIEVLITLTILAVILSVSYASASRSLKASQTSQERTEAQYIALSLIESMKILAQRDSSNVFPSAVSNLCFRTDIPSITAQTPPIPNDPTNLQYNAYCTQGMFRKYVRITPLPVTAQGLAQYEYEAFVEWDSLATGQNQSVLRYKHVRIPVTP